MPRESLLSAYNRASGREGSCETLVTVAGKWAIKEGSAKRTQAGIWPPFLCSLLVYIGEVVSCREHWRRATCWAEPRTPWKLIALLVPKQRSGSVSETWTMLPLSLSTEGFLPLGQLPWISKCNYEIGSYPKLNNILEEGGKSWRVALSIFQAGQIWHLF